MRQAGPTQAAYAHCESVTRAQAANFFYGIRLLPSSRRGAISAVYAFARRVDDIGDGSLEHDRKLALLEAEMTALGHAERGEEPAADDPVMVALTDAYRAFPLPAGALGELIEGVRMDVEGVSYESFEDLVLYCRRVAGAVGRVCLAIFGMREGIAATTAEAEALADELGVAMQITNILRDVREDAENGRVYLPAEDLRRFGLPAEGGQEQMAADLAQMAAQLDPQSTARLRELVGFEAARAREWFSRGIELTALLERRSAASVLAMAGIYGHLLDRIEADPAAALHGRVSLPVAEKAWVAVRSMAGRGA